MNDFWERLTVTAIGLGEVIGLTTAPFRNSSRSLERIDTVSLTSVATKISRIATLQGVTTCLAAHLSFLLLLLV